MVTLAQKRRLLLSGRPVVAPFLPTQATSATLKGWWDATTLVLANDDPVTTWPDLSGNGNDLTGIDTARPTFKALGANGKPAIRTDGVDDEARADGIAAAVNGASWTLMMVARINSTLAATRVLLSLGSALQTGSLLLRTNTTPVWQTRKVNDAGTGVNGTATAGANNTLHVTTLEYDAVGNSWYLFIDGVMVLNNVTAGAPGATTSDTYALGGLRNSAGFASATAMDVGEKAFFAGLLSTSDRQSYERWLGYKWSVTVS